MLQIGEDVRRGAKVLEAGRKLRAQDIGGLLAKSLLEADLIDEIGLNIHPIILGSGIPLFYDMSRQLDLELVKLQPLSNGCVVVTYQRKRGQDFQDKQD